MCYFESDKMYKLENSKIEFLYFICDIYQHLFEIKDKEVSQALVSYNILDELVKILAI